LRDCPWDESNDATPCRPFDGPWLLLAGPALARFRPAHAATHGSPWDYDRRVPILCWRMGVALFKPPPGVRTVDTVATPAVDPDRGPASCCPPRPAGVAIGYG